MNIQPPITADHGYVEGAPYWVTLVEWQDREDEAQFPSREVEPIWRPPVKPER